MKRKMQAIVFRRPDEIAVESFELPPPEKNEMIVKTLYTMVSTGTEIRVLAGEYGSKDKFPFIPGYSAVGEVAEAGKAVKGYGKGSLVSCRNPLPVPGINSMWGGQAGFHRCSAEGEDRPVILPGNAKPLDYVIAEISAISLRGAEAADPARGETAVVIGQGLIGAFSAAWLNLRGCRVITADIEESRLERSYSYGAAAAVNIKEESGAEKLKALLDGGADIVVESSGTTPGMRTACGLLKAVPRESGAASSCGGKRPRLVFQANYIEEIPVNPSHLFPVEAAEIITPADRTMHDRMRAVEAIRRGGIRAEDFIRTIAGFTEAPEAYRRLRDDRANNFSLVFAWSSMP